MDLHNNLLCLFFGLLIFVRTTVTYDPDTCIQCRQSQMCNPPDCFCCRDKMPMKKRDIPQMVFFSFDDAVNPQVAKFYRQLFNPKRLNPNGCPISMTLFVSHRNTVYGLVKEFYEKGMEIASHSVTHGHMNKNIFIREAKKQKENLSKRAGIPSHEITGWRSPFLEPVGDLQPSVLKDLGYVYDATLTMAKKTPKDKPITPFTLDFGWPYDCKIKPCPKRAHKGFWEVPVVTVKDYLNKYDCVYVDGCNNPPPSEGLAYKFLWDNFQKYYTTNRAPMGINMHASWFYYPDRKAAMDRFIKKLVSLEDVYIVSIKQVIEWLKHPTSLQQIQSFQPWQCNGNMTNATSQISRKPFRPQNTRIGNFISNVPDSSIPIRSWQTPQPRRQQLLPTAMPNPIPPMVPNLPMVRFWWRPPGMTDRNTQMQEQQRRQEIIRKKQLEKERLHRIKVEEEKARLLEQRRIEELRKQEQTKLLEQKRLEKQRQQEHARLLELQHQEKLRQQEQARILEQKQQEKLRQEEQARIQEQKRKQKLLQQEQARLLEQKRLEKLKQQEHALLLEQQRLETLRQQEQALLLQQQREEEIRQQEQAILLEQQRIEKLRHQEQLKKQEEAKLLEKQRQEHLRQQELTKQAQALKVQREEERKRLEESQRAHMLQLEKQRQLETVQLQHTQLLGEQQRLEVVKQSQPIDKITNIENIHQNELGPKPVGLSGNFLQNEYFHAPDTTSSNLLQNEFHSTSIATNENLLQHEFLPLPEVVQGNLLQNEFLPSPKVVQGNLLQNEFLPSPEVVQGNHLQNEFLPSPEVIQGNLLQNEFLPSTEVVQGNLLQHEFLPANGAANLPLHQNEFLQTPVVTRMNSPINEYLSVPDVTSGNLLQNEFLPAPSVANENLLQQEFRQVPGVPNKNMFRNDFLGNNIQTSTLNIQQPLVQTSNFKIDSLTKNQHFQGKITPQTTSKPRFANNTGQGESFETYISRKLDEILDFRPSERTQQLELLSMGDLKALQDELRNRLVNSKQPSQKIDRNPKFSSLSVSASSSEVMGSQPIQNEIISSNKPILQEFHIPNDVQKTKLDSLQAQQSVDIEAMKINEASFLQPLQTENVSLVLPYEGTNQSAFIDYYSDPSFYETNTYIPETTTRVTETETVTTQTSPSTTTPLTTTMPPATTPVNPTTATESMLIEITDFITQRMTAENQTQEPTFVTTRKIQTTTYEHPTPLIAETTTTEAYTTTQSISTEPSTTTATTTTTTFQRTMPTERGPIPVKPMWTVSEDIKVPWQKWITKTPGISKSALAERRIEVTKRPSSRIQFFSVKDLKNSNPVVIDQAFHSDNIKSQIETNNKKNSVIQPKAFVNVPKHFDINERGIFTGMHFNANRIISPVNTRTQTQSPDVTTQTTEGLSLKLKETKTSYTSTSKPEVHMPEVQHMAISQNGNVKLIGENVVNFANNFLTAGDKPQLTNKLQKHTEGIPPSDKVMRALPTHIDKGLATSSECMQEINCMRPNCVCKTSSAPDGFKIENTPQIVYITVDGSLNFHTYGKMRALFSRGRKNPNGCSIKGTVFITDTGSSYRIANVLKTDGIELAMMGASSRPYTNSAILKTDLVRQRKRIAASSNISPNDIEGWRSPGLSPVGDDLFSILSNESLYDSSLLLPTDTIGKQIPWPYTLDFGWKSTCQMGKCPKDHHKGVWEVPAIPFNGPNNTTTCEYIDACTHQPASEQETIDYLMNNFNEYYQTNRAPFAIRLKQMWFHWYYRENLSGLLKFLDKILSFGDVYVTSVSDMLEWMKSPKQLQDIKQFDKWKC